MPIGDYAKRYGTVSVIQRPCLNVKTLPHVSDGVNASYAKPKYFDDREFYCRVMHSGPCAVGPKVSALVSTEKVETLCAKAAPRNLW